MPSNPLAVKPPSSGLKTPDLCVPLAAWSQRTSNVCFAVLCALCGLRLLVYKKQTLYCFLFLLKRKTKKQRPYCAKLKDPVLNWRCLRLSNKTHTSEMGQPRILVAGRTLSAKNGLTFYGSNEPNPNSFHQTDKVQRSVTK